AATGEIFPTTDPGDPFGSIFEPPGRRLALPGRPNHSGGLHEDGRQAREAARKRDRPAPTPAASGAGWPARPAVAWQGQPAGDQARADLARSARPARRNPLTQSEKGAPPALAGRLFCLRL